MFSIRLDFTMPETGFYIVAAIDDEVRLIINPTSTAALRPENREFLMNSCLNMVAPNERLRTRQDIAAVFDIADLRTVRDARTAVS